jgi:hypothetical protein
MSFVLVHDATHANISHLPSGQAAGYTTGSADIRWTPNDWLAHLGAVRIDQDPAAGDTTADVLDVERGAATNADAPRWYRTAVASFREAVRPGQRWPLLYTSAANVTPLVNTLVAAGVESGPGLFVANWNLSDAQATEEVARASGPYPVEAIQFTDGNGLFDSSIVSSAWLSNRSSDPLEGPYRHLTDGRSLAEIAALRNTSMAHLWALIKMAYTSEDAAMLGAMRTKGLPYYTTRP